MWATPNQVWQKLEVLGKDNQKMVLARKRKSRNGRIPLCELQDGQRQPRYNLTPGVPSNHSEFDDDGARNAVRIANTHTHRQTLSAFDSRLLFMYE